MVIVFMTIFVIFVIIMIIVIVTIRSSIICVFSRQSGSHWEGWLIIKKLNWVIFGQYDGDEKTDEDDGDHDYNRDDVEIEEVYMSL